MDTLKLFFTISMIFSYGCFSLPKTQASTAQPTAYHNCACSGSFDCRIKAEYYEFLLSSTPPLTTEARSNQLCRDNMYEWKTYFESQENR